MHYSLIKKIYYEITSAFQNLLNLLSKIQLFIYLIMRPAYMCFAIRYKVGYKDANKYYINNTVPIRTNFMELGTGLKKDFLIKTTC